MSEHIIVSEYDQCICGVYGGKEIKCSDIILLLESIEYCHQSDDNPSFFVRKGERNPPELPKASELMKLVIVLQSLIQDKPLKQAPTPVARLDGEG